ncbi:nitroreductase family protein [Zhouia sp. PK063]|uniref:nitroreductase family protein n=1 Tax=Zhouia sp. PK063 TaxID=3373602 RepID=UPI0037B7A179
MSLIQHLQWRYAAKRMTGEVVPQEKIDYITEAIRLTASSSGLQPYVIYEISDRNLLEKIKPIAFNQPQITEASHLLVFAAWNNYSEERVNTVFKRANAERGIPDSQSDDYRKRLLAMFANKSEKENHHHIAKQAYIALGTALLAAAEQGIDATPMEGYNMQALDELLKLNEKGLKSAFILPLGYRAEEHDWLAKLKKVRTPKEEFIIKL